jgi:hypothetical protein
VGKFESEMNWTPGDVYGKSKNTSLASTKEFVNVYLYGKIDDLIIMPLVSLTNYPNGRVHNKGCNMNYCITEPCFDTSLSRLFVTSVLRPSMMPRRWLRLVVCLRPLICGLRRRCPASVPRLRNNREAYPSTDEGHVNNLCRSGPNS